MRRNSLADRSPRMRRDTWQTWRGAIAAILLMGPALDGNYRSLKVATYMPAAGTR
ncbi:MAG: hypothetical protein LC130_03465 [Bryobacterales bacterium]|nr:hypothetical protein [Bryobacterales bacterium]MEB2361829.1 hypothetical protein [Bryobacterales bacterium]